MTMQQYTRSDLLVLFQQQRCPEAYYSGIPVLAQEWVMENFPMAPLSHCTTPVTTHASLASSKGWNRSYMNKASCQLIESWRLNVAALSQSVCLGRLHAAADRFSIIKMISNNKSHCFKNCMKMPATYACTIQNSTVNWILLSSTGEMQNSNIGKPLSLTMTKRWYRICMSAWTQCPWNSFISVSQWVGRSVCTLITFSSYSIQSDRFMNSYWAGLDGPQAAWACKKYHGHCTLPPAAIGEARAHAWIELRWIFHWNAMLATDTQKK